MNKCKKCGQIIDDGLELCSSCENPDSDNKNLLDKSFLYIDQNHGLRCDFCKTSLKDFKKTGRMGCGQCYSKFIVPIKPILKRINRSSNFHVGKFVKPSDMNMETARELRSLMKQFNEAIEDDDLTKATSIKLKINKIQEGMI